MANILICDDNKELREIMVDSLVLSHSVLAVKNTENTKFQQLILF
jgi:hypothetical protein